MESNELIIITLVHIKQTIHLSGPMDETSFLAAIDLVWFEGKRVI